MAHTFPWKYLTKALKVEALRRQINAELRTYDFFLALGDCRIANESFVRMESLFKQVEALGVDFKTI